MSRCHRFFILSLLISSSDLSPGFVARAEETKLPTVVLMGDSIRMGYAPFVSEALKGKATVISDPQNGGDSANLLAHLDEWAVQKHPDIVHFNCGLHDLKRNKKTGQYQIPLEQYETNLKKIIERLQKETTARLIFATTTPIHDDRHSKRGADFDRREADVRQYNEVAIRVAKAAGIAVDDLHAFVVEQGADEFLGPDGTHYDATHSRKLAKVVTDNLTKELDAKKKP